MARSRSSPSYASIPIPILISNILKHPLLWRFVGISSSTIGLLCYALSSSFQHLYGKWTFLKIILYCVVSLIISCIMLFPGKLQSSKSFRVKSHVVFLVLILTSLYSVFYDKSVNGKPDVLSLISNGAFALMSLSLSRQIQPGFESGLYNFFLGCFVVQLIKINLILTSVVAVFCYSLIALRSCMDSKLKIGHVSDDDQLAIDIGTTNEAGFDNLASTEMVDIGFTSGASFDNLESIEMVPIQKEATGANKLRRRSIVKAERTSSSRILQPKRVVGWTEEEHKLFLLGLDKYGKGEWKRISREFVKTRTPAEVANHALKDFIKPANTNRRRQKSNQVTLDLQDDHTIILRSVEPPAVINVDDGVTAASGNETPASASRSPTIRRTSSNKFRQCSQDLKAEAVAKARQFSQELKAELRRFSWSHGHPSRTLSPNSAQNGAGNGFELALAARALRKQRAQLDRDENQWSTRRKSFCADRDENNFS